MTTRRQQSTLDSLSHLPFPSSTSKILDEGATTADLSATNRRVFSEGHLNPPGAHTSRQVVNRYIRLHFYFVFCFFH